MTQESMLPEELLWQSDRDGEQHLSELARSAIGDMQMDILPADVLAHVESCAHCSAHVGAAALLSKTMGDVWTHAPKDALHPAVKKYPVPWRALFGAAFLSAAGMIPVAAELPRMVAALSQTATHSVPVVAHVTLATSTLHGPVAVILPAIASLVLLAASAAFVRLRRSPSLSSEAPSLVAPAPDSSPSSKPRSS